MTNNESIHNLMDTIQRSMDELQVEIKPEKLESVVCLLYYSLKPHGRFFHSIKHALDLTVEGQPLISLTALFHDLIYYQIDGGFHHLVQPLIEPLIYEQSSAEGTLGVVYLREDLDSQDPLMKLNLHIFNFQPGQVLNPYGGLNEFLSSIVMSYTLKSLLSITQLARMIVYLEGTIPFRGPDQHDRDYFHTLAERYAQINQEMKLGETEDTLRETIQQAVSLANRDVANFAEVDARDFLDNTWDLIPETNLSLRQNELYTLRDYRVALQKMSGFFNFLNPSHVYHQYQNYPSDEHLSALTQRAINNVDIAREYLSVKLITSSILDAFATLSGGDAPICLFMGELPRGGSRTIRLEDFLPTINTSNRARLDPHVWQLLDTGRNKESIFDIKNAPLSLLTYSKCSAEELSLISDATQELICGNRNAYELIALIPHGLREDIGCALAKMVPTRRAQLKELLHKISEA